MTSDNDDIKAAAKTTVATFASLIGTPIELQNGVTARTEGPRIVVPFKDSDPYLLVERQLAHILFKSDSSGRDLFVSEFTSKVEAANREKVVDVDKLYLVLSRIVDILESHRIESLWQLLYPGSYAKSKRRLAKEASALDMHSNLLTLLVGIDAGLEIADGPLYSYVPVLSKAVNLVERKDFTATLVVARWLVGALSDLLLVEASGDGAISKLQSLEKISDLCGELPDEVALRYNDYVSKYSTVSTIPNVMSVNTRNTEELDSWLESKETEAISKVQEIQSRLSTEIPPKNWRDTLKDYIVDVRSIPSNDTPLSSSPLTLEDAQTIKRLQRIFSRIRTVSQYRLDDTGTEIDIGALIDRRLTGASNPCFRTTANRRGFEVTVLLDRSASMAGKRSVQAERGARILMESLRLPEVKVQTWGFQGFEGSAVITKFNPRVLSFDSEHSLRISGYTPLHLALRVVEEDLDLGPTSKHLILITDGGPYAVTKRGKTVPERLLRAEVRDIITRLKRKRVNVSTLIVGHKLRDGTPNYDVSVEHAEYMFGSNRSWKYVTEDNLGSDIVELVASGFAAYLQQS